MATLLELRQIELDSKGSIADADLVWTTATTYGVGDVVANAAGLNYAALDAGTSGVIEPAGVATPDDGTLQWQYRGRPAAAQLLGRVRWAVLGFAKILNEEAGTILADSYPSSPNETNEAFYWAKAVLSSPDVMADGALRTVLSAEEGPGGASVAQILSAALTDDTIKDRVEVTIPGAAKGADRSR